MSIDRVLVPQHHMPAMSSAMTSSASEVSDMGGYARRASAPFPKSNIEVNIDHHFNSKVYTSAEPLTGNVTITTKRDVRFDSIQILLIGNTRTRVDGLNVPREAIHTFLKMVMPVPESTYPVPRILETGETYNIPFHFVIPSHLTINACSHQIRSDQLRYQHTLLPPSMGPLGAWEKDDMAPQMAVVEYTIKARVFRQPDLDEKKIKVMEAEKRIQVLPASAEEPPMNLTKQDKMYTMTKSKTVKKNLLGGKLGKLEVEAIQPGAVFIRPDGRGDATTTAQIHLQFNPVSADVMPPKIASISGKVVSHTYYSSGTISDFPDLNDWWVRQFGVDKRGSYSSSVSLPAIPVNQEPWAQQLTQSARRDSGYDSAVHGHGSDSESGSEGARRRSVRRPSTKKSKCPIFHTTSLWVPIRLPTERRMFIPTFHSCIASRVYTLQLSINVGVGSATSTINLTLPLQVAVDSNGLLGMGLPSFESAVEEAEADDHLRPRLLQIPEYQYMETSVLPGYGDLVAAR